MYKMDQNGRLDDFETIWLNTYSIYVVGVIQVDRGADMISMQHPNKFQ